MEGGLVGVGDGVFGAAEALGEGGELGPFGALEGEEDFVEIAVTVFAAAKGGFDFGVDGKSGEDVFQRFVEQGVGNGKKAHEKEIGTFFMEAGGGGKVFAEIGAGEGGADEFGRLTGTHGDDSEDGDPAAEFGFTEQGDGVADAVNFGTEAEGGRIEIAKEAIEEGRLLLEKIFDGVVIEIGSGNGADELELDEFVAGDVASFEHGGLAKEIALEIGIAEIAGFVEVTLGFDFFGEERDAIAGELFGNALAAVGVKEGEINLEIVGEIDERAQGGIAKKIVEGEEIAVLAEFAAEIDDFTGRLDAFENFNHHAVGWKQSGCAEAQSDFVDVNEGAGRAGKRLEIEEGEGIGDDAAGSVAVGLEEVLRAAAEEEFVGVDAQALVENRLAGNKFFVHRAPYPAGAENCEWAERPVVWPRGGRSKVRPLHKRAAGSFGFHGALSACRERVGCRGRKHFRG